jgi:cytochrome c peroxidase
MIMKISKLFNLFFVLAVLTILLYSCKREEPIIDDGSKKDTSYKATPYQITIPLYFPTQLNIPADNPMTVEGIELGRNLFYDGRIRGASGPADSLMSCFTCHHQENSFECGINSKFPNGRPYGVTGIFTPHTMLPFINLVWCNTGYLWNGIIEPSNTNVNRRRLEDLVWMGIYAPHEMKSDSLRSKAMIQSIPGYASLFKKAFGSTEISFKRISYAIAQFIRSLISSDSKFDRYLRGQENFTDDERAGFILFVTEEGADCFHCHGGDGNPLFTTNLFYNNAKDVVFNDPRDRFAVTGNPTDHGAYKAPTLRNIEVTAPYMHDGRFKTLDEVIDFYSDSLVNSPYVSPLMHKINQGGAHLTPLQKAQLKAFLLTLTDHTFLNDPKFGPPASLPQ